MTVLFDLFIKFFSFLLESVGTIASYTPCTTYFDEPEVPEELTNAKKIINVRKCERSMDVLSNVPLAFFKVFSYF